VASEVAGTACSMVVAAFMEVGSTEAEAAVATNKGTTRKAETQSMGAAGAQ